MSEQSLEMRYHPIFKEVRFKRFQNGKEIPISDISRLRKYMRKKGNFILQDEKYEIEFLNDIAAAFEGEEELDIEVVTTKKDFGYFEKLVSRYNENREDKCLIRAKLIGSFPDLDKAYSEYIKQCNKSNVQGITALKRKIAGIDKIIADAEIEFAVPKNLQPSITDIVSLGLSSTAQERIIGKIEKYLDEKLTGKPSKEEEEEIKERVNEIADEFRTDFLKKLDTIVRRKENKYVNRLKTLIKDSDVAEGVVGTGNLTGNLPLVEVKYEQIGDTPGILQNIVENIAEGAGVGVGAALIGTAVSAPISIPGTILGYGVYKFIKGTFFEDKKADYINNVKNTVADVLKEQSDDYGIEYCRILKGKLKGIKDKSAKIKAVFLKEIKNYNTNNENITTKLKGRSENILQEIQNCGEDCINLCWKIKK